MDQADLEDFRLSPLQTFFAKVAIVTGAVLVLVYVTTSVATSFVDAQAQQLNQQLKAITGGPAFWSAIEQKLYALADAPDVAPEKKKKIIDSLRRLSIKYKPYIDALGDDGSPSDQDRKRVQP
jgi:hypothetical protein